MEGGWEVAVHGRNVYERCEWWMGGGCGGMGGGW